MALLTTIGFKYYSLKVHAHHTDDKSFPHFIMRFWHTFLRLFAAQRQWRTLYPRRGTLFNRGHLFMKDDEESQITAVPKRKALLLGISGSGILPLNREEENAMASSTQPEQGIINGPRRDATDMRQVLIDIYNYNPMDITILIDDGDPETMQPTKENIINAMRNLVADARPGDRFYFHYSGHGMQLPDDNGDEEDGWDECIVTSDDKEIRDDRLKEIMVNPLPPGCSLVCVFDACHSGTLLDLVHYRCNRVYVPWVSKGIPRESKLDIIRAPDGSSERQTERQAGERLLTRLLAVFRRWCSWLPGLSVSAHHLLVHSPTVLSAEEAGKDVITADIVQTSYPDRHFCTGGCRKDPYFLRDARQPVADVISLSAAKDYQLSWGTDGCSLTQALIGILEKDKNPRLTNLLKSISHELHKPYLELHQQSREYERWLQQVNHRRQKQGKALKEGRQVETENFQDPQISSHRPLSKDKRWQL